MEPSSLSAGQAVRRDLVAGLVVFLVALPLCLGIALASGTPLFSGLVSGIIGGVVVGALSGSHTSVSGPAAGLTAIVLALLASLKSFDAFLLAVFIAGAIQVVLGLLRAGIISAFAPTSVIRGLMAAIGVILVLKQIPHVLGHDADPEGEMDFIQPDHENTFSELLATLGDVQLGAAVIGVLSVLLLLLWEKLPHLRRLPIPAPVAVVALGFGLAITFDAQGGAWVIADTHLVQVPAPTGLAAFADLVVFPDFTQWNNMAVYSAALTIALVASLETLLNVQAVDKLDPQQRVSPANRELIAQGVGNALCGLIGGLPVTAVIIRGSVNINAGATSKRSAITHGVLLALSVALFGPYLNMLPLSCLAAILFVTGTKLASPAMMRRMLLDGPSQSIPFFVTLVGIVLTNLLLGICFGVVASLGFVLNSHFRHPLRRVVEQHVGGEVVHIELADQVSFLHRAALESALREVPKGGQVLLDAHNTEYIDPDILAVIRDFKEVTAPTLGISLSMVGFREQYQLDDRIEFVDYTTRELRAQMAPAHVLAYLQAGNDRFRTGRRLSRDLGRQIDATSRGQHPMAVVLSCIDSRTPAELVLDLGLGDIFSVRLAGNVISPRALGSMEFGCAVAGAKLILVMGHTSCGAVTAAVDFAGSGASVALTTGCTHLESIVHDIQRSLDGSDGAGEHPSDDEKAAFVDRVARRNVIDVVRRIVTESPVLAQLIEQGRLAVVGAMYDIQTGAMEFLTDDAYGLPHGDPPPRSNGA